MASRFSGQVALWASGILGLSKTPEVTCKRDRFGYWNLCKRLPNFVNVAALLNTHVITTIMGMMAILIPQNGSRADRGVSCCFMKQHTEGPEIVYAQTHIPRKI